MIQEYKKQPIFIFYSKLETCLEQDNICPRYFEDLTFDELKTYSSFSMLHMYRLSDWHTNLRLLPPINSLQALQYLLKFSVINKDQSRAYKLCKPYKIMNFVHSIKLHRGVGRFSFIQYSGDSKPVNI